MLILMGLPLLLEIKNYDAIDLPEVSFAINDAEALRFFLVNSMGYKEGNILFYTNTTKSELEMIFGIRDNHKGILYDYIKPGKSDVFIFYSGHGAPDLSSNRAYFIPKDCNPSKIAFTGYSLDVFYENLSKLPAKKINVVVDACFSGGTNSGRWIVHHASPALIKISNPTLKNDNIAIITSTETNQVSSWYPEKKHGLFTYFFIKAVSGEADKNKDKVITYREVYNYLSDRADGIPYWAKRLHGGRVQIPTLSIASDQEVLISYINN